MAPLYIRGADVAVIVYDVTSSESAEAVSYWLDELAKSEEDLVAVIVGNKIDVGRGREVTTEKGQTMAMSYGCMFFETSAQTGENVEALFVSCARSGWEKKRMKDLKKSSAAVDLNGDAAAGGDSKCGC